MPKELDGRHLEAALPEEAIGVKFRADVKFIQVFFEETNKADTFIEQGLLQVGEHVLPILPPKGKLPPVALIRMENMPIKNRKYLENAVNQIMAKFCLPVEIAPRTIKGSRLLTTRWEMLAKTIPGKNLSKTLPTTIIIDGQKVLLSWSGSPPTCLQCLSAGHLRRNCPKRAKPMVDPKQTNKNTKPTATPQQNKDATYAKVVAQSNQSDSEEINLGLGSETENQGPSNKSKNPLHNKQTVTPEPSDPNKGPTYDERSPFIVPQTQMEGVSTQNPNRPSNKRNLELSPSPSPKQNQQPTSSYSFLGKLRRTDSVSDDINTI